MKLPSLFDPDQFDILLELCDEGDICAIELIVSQFLEDLVPLLKRLDVGVANANFSEVANVAHSLKGSCSTFGMTRVESASRELEAVARASATAEVAQWAECLFAALGPSCEAMQAHMVSLKARVTLRGR